MDRDKYDFINDLLKNNKLSTKQKERIIKLSSIEINKDKSKGDDILRRVEVIEEKIDFFTNGKDKIRKKEKSEQVKASDGLDTDLPKYIDPFKNGLSNFLKAYNQHPILKYSCHLIDSVDVINSINAECGTDIYNVAKHQELLVNEYEKLLKGYYLNHNVKNLIYAYLRGTTFGNKAANWTTDRIYINWGSAELLSWFKDNNGHVPHPDVNIKKINQNSGFVFSTPIRSNFTGKKINDFSSLVLHFKNLFHLNATNSLKSITKLKNRVFEESARIEFLDNFFLETIELFTDVDKLIQAYMSIINMILEVSRSYKLNIPYIELSFIEEDDKIKFIIHHKNSLYYRKSPDSCVDRIGSSQSNLIKNQINGLCELFIQAKFEGENQFFEINLWNNLPRIKRQIDHIEGVKYILKFSR